MKETGFFSHSAYPDSPQRPNHPPEIDTPEPDFFTRLFYPDYTAQQKTRIEERWIARLRKADWAYRKSREELPDLTSVLTGSVQPVDFVKQHVKASDQGFQRRQAFDLAIAKETIALEAEEHLANKQHHAHMLALIVSNVVLLVLLFILRTGSSEFFANFSYLLVTTFIISLFVYIRCMFPAVLDLVAWIGLLAISLGLFVFEDVFYSFIETLYALYSAYIHSYYHKYSLGYPYPLVLTVILVSSIIVISLSTKWLRLHIYPHVIVTIILCSALALGLVIILRTNPSMVEPFRNMDVLTYGSLLLAPFTVSLFVYSIMLRRHHAQRTEMHQKKTKLTSAIHAYETYEDILRIQKRIQLKKKEVEERYLGKAKLKQRAIVEKEETNQRLLKIRTRGMVQALQSMEQELSEFPELSEQVRDRLTDLFFHLVESKMRDSPDVRQDKENGATSRSPRESG